jgi:positive regulator of sigma E activity
VRDLGKIVALEGKMAQVAIQPHDGCGNCPLKKSCSTAGNTQLLWALNPKAGAVGDEVVVELNQKVRIASATLVFIFPLIGLFSGYLIGFGWGGNDDYAVAGAILGLVLFLALVKIADKIAGQKEKLKPVIVQALK